LLRATEAKLQPLRDRVERGTLRGSAKIGLAVGAPHVSAWFGTGTR